VAIAGAPENITSASGPLWILLNTALVLAGSFAGSAFAFTTARRRQSAIEARTGSSVEPSSTRNLQRLTIACIGLGIFYIATFLHAQGIGIGQLTNVGELGRAAFRMSVARYSAARPASGIVLQLLLSVSYLAPLLGGTLFVCWRRRSDKIVGLLSLLPSLVAFATQSTRSSIVYGLSMWAAGFLATRIYEGLRAQKINRKALTWVALSIPAALLLISVGDVLRGGGKGRDSVASHLLSNRTKTYMCGHLAALSQWMDNTDLTGIHPAFGQFTFAGGYEVLHPGTRVGGVIAEMETLPTGHTNVYTYFRQMIQDLTVSGSLLAVFVIALCSGYAYRRVLDRASGWIGILALCYGAMLLVLTSIFNYNSMILAFLIYGGVWRFLMHPKNDTIDYLDLVEHC
jgi:oligosaccharide repeat unit polymerase